MPKRILVVDDSPECRLLVKMWLDAGAKSARKVDFKDPGAQAALEAAPNRDVYAQVWHALCAAVMFFLAWQVWIKATRIASYGDTTEVLSITIGPFVYFMALMIALTGAVHVFKIFEKQR